MTLTPSAYFKSFGKAQKNPFGPLERLTGSLATGAVIGFEI